MRYRNSIIWLTTFILSFCLLLILPDEDRAQTRKKRTANKSVSKRKTVVKKNAPQVYTVKGVPDSNPIMVGSSPEIVETKTPPPKKPETVSLGIVNGKAIGLITPAYPPAAKAVRASGAVNIQVIIDEQGSVISATALSGHPLLRQAAEQAARESKFSPTMLSGQPVKVKGIIVYNFVAQ